MANLKDFFRDLLNWEAQQTYAPTDEIPQELRNETGVIHEKKLRSRNTFLSEEGSSMCAFYVTTSIHYSCKGYFAFSRAHCVAIFSLAETERLLCGVQSIPQLSLGCGVRFVI